MWIGPFLLGALAAGELKIDLLLLLLLIVVALGAAIAKKVRTA